MASMKLASTQAERILGIQWVVATIAGWGIGFYVCEAIKPFLYDITHLGGDGLVIGTGIGVAQGLVLRKRIGSMRWWVLVTIVGFGLGKLIGESVAQGMPAVLGHGLSGAVIGASVGLAQWLVLRRHLARAEAWVLANVAAWAVGWSLISLAEGSAWSTVMVYAVGGVGAGLAGIITTVALIWVSRGRSERPAGR
jgi:hypothetical protein